MERVELNPRTSYDACVHCGGAPWLLMTAGASRPFRTLVRDHWRGQVSWGLVPVLVGVFLWAELSLGVARGRHGLLAVAWSWGVAHALAAAFFAVMVDTARGPDEVARTETLELVSEAIRPSLPLAFLLWGWLWLPTLAQRSFGIDPHQALWNPLFLVLAAGLGVALLWLGIRIALQLDGGVARAHRSLPPLGYWLGAAAGLFFHLFLFASAWAVQIGLWGWARPLLGLFALAEPFRMSAALTLFLLGRAAGFLLHAHAPELGFVLPERYQVPRLGGAVPRGQRIAAPAPKRSREPIEL